MSKDDAIKKLKEALERIAELRSGRDLTPYTELFFDARRIAREVLEEIREAQIDR